MNKTFKTIWNQARGCFVVASEMTSAHGKQSSTSKAVVTAVAGALMALGAGQAVAGAVGQDWSNGNINNSAGITGTQTGILASGQSFTGSITNSGTISGGVSNQAIKIYHSTINGGITNSGLLTGGIKLSSSQLSGAIVNAAGGTISGEIYMQNSIFGGLTNSGTVGGRVLGLYVNGNVINDGVIGDYVQIYDVTGRISNSGTITTSVREALGLFGNVAQGFTNTGTIINTTTSGAYGLRVSGALISGTTAIDIQSGTVTGGASGGGIYIESSTIRGSSTAIKTSASAVVGDINISSSLVSGKLDIQSTRDGSAATNVFLDRATLSLPTGASTIAGNLTTNGNREVISFAVDNLGTHAGLTVGGTASFGTTTGYIDLSLASGNGIVATNTITGLVSAATLSGASNLYVRDNSVLLDFTLGNDATNLWAVASAASGCGATVSGNVAGYCEIGFDSPNITIANTGNISGGTLSGASQIYGIRALVGNYSGSITNHGVIAFSGPNAYGIYLDSVGLTGNIVNDGVVSAGPAVSGGTVSGNGSAIFLTHSTLTGSIINNAGGTLSGFNDGAISLSHSTITGGITNSGLIEDTFWAGIAISNGSLVNGILNNTAGTISGDSYGIIISSSSTLTGGLINHGKISANSSGLAIYGGSTLSGGLINSGSITGGNYGIYLSGALTGGIVNSDAGKISGGSYGIYLVSGGIISGGLVNHGTISGASFAGIGIYSSSTLSGGITNTGVISGTNNAIAISHSTVAGGLHNLSGGLITASGGYAAVIISGTSLLNDGLHNSGMLIGDGANGVYVSGSSVAGGIHNNGTIAGEGTIVGSSAGILLSHSAVSGGIANNGTLSLISGANFGVYLYSGSVLSDGLTNAGTISAVGSSGVAIKVSNSAISGSIANSGTIQGNSTGVRFVSHSTLTGGLTNSGTISGGNRAIYVDSSSSLDSIVITGNNTAKFIGEVFAENTPVTVASGATYTMDNGQLFTLTNSSFTNAGTLKIGATTSTGSVGTITGNFVNTGTFSPQIADMTHYGQLTVTGTANLGGKFYANAASVAQGALTEGGTLTGVITAGTLAGTFSPGAGGKYDDSNYYDLTPVYDTANGIFSLTIAAASQTAVSASTTAVGNTPAGGAATVFDAIIAGSVPTVTVPGNSQMADVIAALDRLAGEGDQQVSDAVSQTLPLMSASNNSAMSNTMRGVNRIIQARQEGNRGLSSGDDFLGDKHFWLKPFGSWANQGNRKGVTGFDANTAGLLFGADAELDDSNRIGAAFAYARSDVSSNNGSLNKADIDSYQLALYGSHSVNDTTDINFQADIGNHNTNGSRRIPLMGTVAKSDYDTTSAHVGVGVGRIFSFSDATSFTPSVRADYTWLRDESYRENGAGALNLDVNSHTTEELILSVDGKLNRKLSDNVVFTANLGAGYDVINEQSSVTAAFAGAPGLSFRTEGLDPSPWLARGGLGISNTTSKGVEVSVRYDFEVRNDFDNQTASVKVRLPF